MRRWIVGIVMGLCVGLIGCTDASAPPQVTDDASDDRAVASRRRSDFRAPRRRLAPPTSRTHRRTLARLERRRDELSARDGAASDLREIDARIEALRAAVELDLPATELTTTWIDEQAGLHVLGAQGYLDGHPRVRAARARVAIAREALEEDDAKTVYPAIEVGLRMAVSDAVLLRGLTEENVAVRCMRAQLAALATCTPPARRRPELERLHVEHVLDRVEQLELRGLTREHPRVVATDRKIAACEVALASDLPDDVVERTLRLELRRIELVALRGFTDEHPDVAKLDAELTGSPERYTR